MKKRETSRRKYYIALKYDCGGNWKPFPKYFVPGHSLSKERVLDLVSKCAEPRPEAKIPSTNQTILDLTYRWYYRVYSKGCAKNMDDTPSHTYRIFPSENAIRIILLHQITQTWLSYWWLCLCWSRSSRKQLMFRFLFFCSFP